MNAKLDDTLTHARYFSLLLPLACHLPANAFPITLFLLPPLSLSEPSKKAIHEQRELSSNNLD